MSVVAEPQGTGMRGQRRVGLWLLAICLLLSAMVMLGGLTRLTQSGLSITEWRPVTGVVPPLDAAHWQAEFEKYQKIPEYQLINKGMTLDDFKRIYWWEWAHRLLGRLIGVAFLVPFVAFILTRTITPRDIPRFAGLFVLGGLQGALGWFMVKSGLSVRTDVSQYRLAAHLVLAFIIFGAIFWTALGQLRTPFASLGVTATHRRNAAILVGLVLLQIGVGGFVAGLDAGFSYNTWPLMDGRLVPHGLSALSPGWRNLFENTVTVQFIHRMTAYCVVAWAIWTFMSIRRIPISKGTFARKTAHYVLAGVTLQAMLGIATLLTVVPVALGALHQLGALATYSLALLHLHALGRAGTIA